MKGKTTFLAKAFIMLFAVLCSFTVARADEVVIGDGGTANNQYLPGYNFYNYSWTQQIYTADEIGMAGTINSIAFKNTGAEKTRTYSVYMQNTDKETFTGQTDWVAMSDADLVFTGELTFAVGEWTVIELDTPFEYDGTSNLLVGVADNTGSYSSSPHMACLVFDATSQAIRVYRDASAYDIAAPGANGSIQSVKNQIVLDITQGEGPAVAKPRNVTITYAGGTEATVSWDAVSGATAYEVDVNGTVLEATTTTTKELTDLEFATVYTVKVRATDGTNFSDWTSPKSFTTDISDDMCQVELVLQDTYGDGWSGATLGIVDVLTGIVLGTYTIDNTAGKDPQTIYADVPNNRDVQLVWTSGTQPTWEKECIFTVTDVNGEVIYAFDGSTAGTGPTAGVLKTWTVCCTVMPWRAPSDLTASEVGSSSAKLSWTENSLTPATAWVVAFKAEGETEFGEEDADSNPYVLAGLSPETKYIVKVRPATDEAEKWSDEISFTTDVAFPAPTAVAASNITATSANITWTGNASSYNLRYRTSVLSTATVILTADDVWGDGSGYQMLLDADATAFGTVYDENGWNISDYSDFEYTIPTNADFDYNTTAFVINNSVTIQIPAGTYDWYITNPSPDYQFVYVAASNGNVGGRQDNYVFEAGKTYEFVPSMFGENDGIDVTITGEASTTSGEVGEWVVVNNVTSPYTIEGLTPETYYEVQVQALYDTDESTWASTGFTTLEDFPRPTDLAVSEIGPKSAVLNWTENGEATAWEICLNDDETALIAADDNTFTLTGLTPETDYTAKVRAVNGEKKSAWSKALSFTTDIATPAPTELAVSDVTSSTASVSWTGFGESYNLRYRTYEGEVVFSDDFENGLDAWTIVRNGEGTEYTDWRQFNGAFSGNTIPAHSGEYLAMSRSWSSSAYSVDNWLITPAVELGGTLKYWVMDDGQYHEHYDIYVCTTTFDANSFDENAFTKIYEPGDATNEWTEQTVDLSSYAGQTGYIAFRHTDNDQDYLFIDDVTIESALVTGEWVEVNDVTSPYAIEGLTPETKYEVAVQGVYPEGTSEWATATFTTLNTNPVPYDIAADLAADGGTLTWKGEGESYNLRYRTAQFIDASFYDNFNDLSQWTIYTEGEGPGWFISEYGATALSYDNDTYTSWAADNWLVSPQVNLRGTLEFYDNTASNYPDSYEVRLSLTGNTIADFNNGIVLRDMAVAGNNYVDIDLSAYEGQEGYIAIHHVSEDCYILAIPFIGIFGDGSYDAGEWQTMTVTEPTATISGLATNNAYEVQVQSVKGTDESEWCDAFEFALLSLDSNADNSAPLLNYGGMQAHVTLANRTLYQDGTWNTLCLPFSLDADALAASPLAGADFRTLAGIDVTSTSVTLNFSAQGEYDTLYGTFPWIVKWESGSNIVNPQFANVTLYSSTNSLSYSDAASGYGVTFKGTYAKKEFTTDNTSILFVGADNKLNYPLAGAKVGAFRGYFELEGFTMDEESGVKIFTNLDDEDATGIANVEKIEENTDWYDLSGRKLAGKPSMKGIYVNGGRKVTVK